MQQMYKVAWDDGQRQHPRSDSGAVVHTSTAGGASRSVESSVQPLHGSSRDKRSRHVAAAAVDQQAEHTVATQGVSQIASSSAGQDGLSRLRRMALAAQKRVRR